MKKITTRRDFMREGSYAVLSVALGLPSKRLKKSRVVLIRHSDALDKNSIFNEKIIQQMLDEAVMALFEQNNSIKAFQELVKPDDVVGIKSNVWTYLPTPPELERAIVRRVVDAGVKKNNISIDDRGVRKNPTFQKATALINVRPLRTHYVAGLSGCMKNYIMFAEKGPSEYHPNNCADLALLFELPMVKGKTRLNILCALTPLFHARGPHHFSRRYLWNYKGIILGTDPVAVDAIGLEIIKAKRSEQLGKERELPPYPRAIKVADVKYGLGISDLKRIDLIKLGWKEEILI